MYRADASCINDLDESEQNLCLEYLEAKPLGLRFTFALYLETGIRVSEGLSLTLGDAREAIKLKYPYLNVITLKRKRPMKRKIPICKQSIHRNHHFSLYTIMRDWLNHRNKEPDCNALITHLGRYSRTPHPQKFIHRKNLHAAIKEVFKNVGVPDRRVHDLRHTFAINKLKNGMTLPVLQNLLGHYSLQSTSVYVKPRMSDIFQQMGTPIK